MRPRAGNLACHAGTFSTAAGNSCRGIVAAASSRLRRPGPVLFEGVNSRARLAGVTNASALGRLGGGSRHAGAPARGPTIALGHTTKGDEFTAPQLTGT